MARSAKAVLKRALGKLCRAMLTPADRKRLDRVSTLDRVSQAILSHHYRQLLREQARLPSLEEVEFGSFSQTGEDGILHFIFSLIGTNDRRAIEICAGDGITCNAANLIVNHGWTALLVDGDAGNVHAGNDFYKECPETRVWPPTFVQAWVTAENVNSIIEGAGFSGEIDLLSLDIDGMDYWVWKAIKCATPRVVVLEFQNIWGSERSVTVPYDPLFVAEFVNGEPNYAGASLAAFIKLGREKGYRLVGCQSYGFNAFFIRSGVGEDIFPEVDPASCFTHPCSVDAIKRRLPLVVDRDWEEV